MASEVGSEIEFRWNFTASVLKQMAIGILRLLGPKYYQPVGIEDGL